MSAVLARVRAAFLAPAGAAAIPARPATQVAERVAPLMLGVLCPAGAEGVAGTAIALAAARRAGASCAVVCRWTGEDEEDAVAGEGVPALPAARRLAGRLAARGLAVRARGRLAVVELPGAAVPARAAAERVVAAAPDGVPVVLVLAGARPEALDGLLAELDRVVVMAAPDAPDGLEDLAVMGAARLGRATGLLRLAPSAAARAAAAAGVALPPGVRAAAEAALDGRAG